MYPQYSASSLGRIRRDAGTYKRVIKGVSIDQPIRERILKLNADRDGYLRCCMYTPDHKKSTQKVQRLVAQAFYGISSLHVDHINMIRDDNRVINLEYVTEAENNRRKLSVQSI